LVRKM